MRKYLVPAMAALCALVISAPAFAEGEGGFDFATALAPLQTQIMSALSVAVGIGIAIFVVVFGVRKAVSLIRGLSGR